MAERLGTYPFGEPLYPVVQTDRTPKRAFVLGVYSSAVHARWVDPSGKPLAQALAVASEPYIFWRGDGINAILQRIKLPAGAGFLQPAAPRFGGPSGMSLDNDILAPLGLHREEAWLCDLLPHTCLNPNQKKALARAYVPRQERLGLPGFDMPDVPKCFANDARREQILHELVESRADLVLLLGDEPIRHWLRHFDARWNRLSEFGEYGRLHDVSIRGRDYRVLPLAHPRQIAGIGSHSSRWRQAHAAWKSGAQSLLAGPPDGRVAHNGVEMDSGWPDHIREAQNDLFYVIGGQRHDRIRYGFESEDWGADRAPCHDCGVVRGQYHVRGCDAEECPTCHGQAIACDCPYDRSQGWG